MLASGADLRGYRSREYIKDAGTPYRLAKVISDLATDRVARRSFKFLARAAFLDRDGTLNQDRGHIATPESFALFPKADQAIKRLNDLLITSLLLSRTSRWSLVGRRVKKRFSRYTIESRRFSERGALMSTRSIIAHIIPIGVLPGNARSSRSSAIAANQTPV